jgi:hypothetical protein
MGSASKERGANGLPALQKSVLESAAPNGGWSSTGVGAQMNFDGFDLVCHSLAALLEQ